MKTLLKPAHNDPTKLATHTRDTGQYQCRFRHDNETKVLTARIIYLSNNQIRPNVRCDICSLYRNPVELGAEVQRNPQSSPGSS